jgi:cobalt/nickel transport system permease protein
VLYVHGHSAIHRLPPEVKVAATLIFVIGVALTPREAVWVFGVHAAFAVVAVSLARIPASFLMIRLAGILPFILFAFVIPFIGGGEQTVILGVELSIDGLWAAWNIIAKALLGATASIALVATTEVPDILRGMARLRVPALLVAIVGFMVRYLELLVGEVARMRVAMTARGYDPRWLWQAKPIATGSAALFVRSYERGERVHAAMLSRGFTGVMPIRDATAVPFATWTAGLALPVIALVLAVSALVAV